MRCLIVYSHPRANSFTAAIRDHVISQLTASGATCRIHDLYADGFSPALSAEDLLNYAKPNPTQAPVPSYIDDLLWADSLIFVYPTWWYGPPAMLKGWMDRILLPGIAFHMPKGGGDIAPGLTHITRLAVFTTCGASQWLTVLIGEPGKRIFFRGLRLLCHRRCKTRYIAHYSMDRSTAQTRAAHLNRIARTLARF